MIRVKIGVENDWMGWWFGSCEIITDGIGYEFGDMMKWMNTDRYKICGSIENGEEWGDCSKSKWNHYSTENTVYYIIISQFHESLGFAHTTQSMHKHTRLYPYTPLTTQFPGKPVSLFRSESLQKCLVLRLRVLLAISTEPSSCGQRRCWLGGGCWACRKGLNPQFAKMSANMKGMNFAFPEMVLKNERMTQLAKLTTRSRRFCALQVLESRSWWGVDAEAADWCHLSAADVHGRDSDRFPGPH